jgi:fumarate hydratase class II
MLDLKEFGVWYSNQARGDGIEKFLTNLVRLGSGFRRIKAIEGSAHESLRTSRAPRSCRAKVNPTQAEALTMIAVQVISNDVAAGFGGAGGYLEMNVYKPLIIFNITHSITILTDGCTNFNKFLVEGTKPNLAKIKEYVDRSLMLVTALAPVIGYDKSSKIAAALKLGFVTQDEFDRVVNPAKMVKPYVATAK